MNLVVELANAEADARRQIDFAAKCTELGSPWLAQTARMEASAHIGRMVRLAAELGDRAARQRALAMERENETAAQGEGEAA